MNQNHKKFVYIISGILVIVLVGTLGYALGARKALSIHTPQQRTVDLEQARTTLTNYFDFLNQKQYREAVKYHGSGYDNLQDWNPTLPSLDHTALIKAGCENNGLQCLKIKNIVSEEQISATEFKFVVQFAQKDGSLFKQGPCCGATEKDMPTKTDFEFTVKKINNEFLVTTAPVYTP